MTIMKRIANKLRVLSGGKPAVAPSPLLAYINPDFLYPQSTLMRLGSGYGGWNIPCDAKLGPDSICYLAGAGEDISFDCALVEHFGCIVRIVDPTPRAIRHFEYLSAAVNAGERFPINGSATQFYVLSEKNLARLQFLPYGLADDDVGMKFYLPKNPDHVSCSTLNLQKTDEWFTAQCHRLSTLMALQGDRSIALLKMDIEGGEYAVIKDMVASALLPELLLIEFDEAHTPLDNDAGERIRAHISMLVQAGMRCISLDGCNATFLRQP